jgi:hypothetical protein
MNSFQIQQKKEKKAPEISSENVSSEQQLKQSQSKAKEIILQ